jgi:hypothetical protein
VNISIEGNTAAYEVITLNGEILKTGDLLPNDVINLEDLSAGKYMIRIHSGLKSAIIPIIKQ